MEKRCSECGEKHNVCPDCGSRKYTPHESDDSDSQTSTSLKRFVRNADDGDSLTYKDVCWECGYTHKRTVTVSFEDEPADAIQ